MESLPSGPWTIAARAAYFGDQMCPFCDHRNPVGAKFCNDCGSPLDLKPCNQCSAVNHLAATNCYQCGAECSALFTRSETTPGLPAADPTAAGATPGDVDVALTEMQPLFPAERLRVGWSLAAMATILTASVYAVYRISAATPDATVAASQSIGASEHMAPTAASAVPIALESASESKPPEPDTTVALQAPIPATIPETPKRANTRERPPPFPAAKHASARQRPVPELHAAIGATPPAGQILAAAPTAAVAKPPKAHQPDPWQAMHVSLASCGGDLIARIVCDQRVRRRFCEHHWGEAQECGSGVPNDHGQ